MEKDTFYNFRPTDEVGNYVKFDDVNRRMRVKITTRLTNYPEDYALIRYEDVKDAELTEDGGIRVLVSVGGDRVIPVSRRYPKEALTILSRIRTIGFKL